MEKKILEKMIDNLVEEAGPIAIEEMIQEDLKALNEDTDIKFSKMHEQKMKKIFAEARRIENKPRRINLMRKVAVVAVAVVLVSGLTISSVGAWRESFVKYFLDIKEEYSEVNKKHIDSDFTVENIYFGYIPSGFKYDSIEKSFSNTMVSFSSENEYFILKIKKGQGSNKVNTESGDIRDAVINDKDMVYSENDIMKILTWSDGRYDNMLQGNCNKKIFMKIAENIKIKE